MCSKAAQSRFYIVTSSSRRRGALWSAYLATSTCATTASVGMPFSIRRSGAGACTTSPSQISQAYLGRRITVTLNCAGTMSSRSDTSSPMRCLRPPQHAQVLSATSITISSRGKCSGNVPRLIFRLCVATGAADVVLFCSAAASIVASVCSMSSSQAPADRDRAVRNGVRSATKAIRRTLEWPLKGLLGRFVDFMIKDARRTTSRPDNKRAKGSARQNKERCRPLRNLNLSYRSSRHTRARESWSSHSPVNFDLHVMAQILQTSYCVYSI